MSIKLIPDKCEYPNCKNVGKPIGKNEGAAILCKKHEDMLDKLLEGDDDYISVSATEFMLKLVANRIKKGLS